MRRWKKRSLRTIGTLLGIWLILTIWAQQPRSAPGVDFGAPDSRLRALVVYNPDPFYDLDRQVCEAFASGLAAEGWSVQVRTYGDAPGNLGKGTDLLLTCANTYNWAPDRRTRRYIRDVAGLAGKPVVAITLGSGSTGRSKRLLESSLTERKARLLQSDTYWLMRPNDESRMEESNVKVACDLARGLGTRVAVLFRAVKMD